VPWPEAGPAGRPRRWRGSRRDAAPTTRGQSTALVYVPLRLQVAAEDRFISPAKPSSRGPPHLCALRALCGEINLFFMVLSVGLRGQVLNHKVRVSQPAGREGRGEPRPATTIPMPFFAPWRLGVRMLLQWQFPPCSSRSSRLRGEPRLQGRYRPPVTPSTTPSPPVALSRPCPSVDSVANPPSMRLPFPGSPPTTPTLVIGGTIPSCRIAKCLDIV